MAKPSNQNLPVKTRTELPGGRSIQLPDIWRECKYLARCNYVAKTCRIYLAKSHAPGGIGGGAGMFSWFENEKAMIEFIVRFPLLAQTAQESDPAFIERSRAILQTAAANGHLDESTIQRWNATLRGVEQIKWVGQLVDLTQGESHFAQEIREAFNDGGGAIPNNKLVSFIDFLKSWGY